MSDGNLRQLEMQHIRDCHWQSIETWSTGQGVPDVNGCIDGVEFWIENKLTNGYSVNISSHQIAWIERRVRNGGRVFVAVRRVTSKGPRKGKAADEFWLFHGSQARALAAVGLASNRFFWLGMWEGGPARWSWPAIRTALTSSII